MREIRVGDIDDFVGSGPRKRLIADLFCGAGGTSEGIKAAMLRLGLPYEIVCLNHWPVAIGTHSMNHPEARHYCQDIAAVRPHIVCPEGYLDLLCGSPTCTHHSIARGGKPTSDQQRSDPWHLITWFTELRVKRAIIENVWEYVKWGPVDPETMRPVKEREGIYHNAWIETIWRVGATSIEWRKLNAANFGGATTRERYFAFIRFDGKPLLWPVATHAKLPKAGSELKRWRPAREIIDWSIKGKSIFKRPIPLSPKTLARILAGALKFGWPAVFIVLLAVEMERALKHAIRYSFARRHTKRADLRRRYRKRVIQYGAWLRQFRGEAIKATAGAGVAMPMLVTLRRNADGRSLELPAPTLAAGGRHIGIVEPVVINGRRGNHAKPVSEGPVPTLDTKGGVWLAEPFLLATGSTGAAQSANEPMPTATTGGAGSADPGCARPMLIEPFILNRHGDNGSVRAHGTDEPMPTADCRGAGYVVEPFMLSRQGGGAPRSTDEPTPTQAAKHSHILIAPYYGSGSGTTCTSAEQPMPAIPTKDRFSIIIPVTHNDASDRARRVDTDPLPTLTTAKRGELAFITAQFGEREGQAPRVHSLDEPSPGICATGHINLVEATATHDVLFRMLEPHELAAAMGFNRLGNVYRFTGNKTEQVKQIGNAVEVHQMEANVYALMQDDVEPAPQFMEAAE